MTKGKNKTFRIIFVLLAILALVMSSFVFAYADGDTGNEYSIYADENQYFGTESTETGYDLVYEPLLDLFSAYFTPLISLLVAIGSVYAIVLGVKFAKAEDPQEREKVKAYIKNLIIGIIALFIIFGVSRIFMPIFSQYAASQTDDLDQDNLYNYSSSEDEDTNERVDIYSIDAEREKDSDEDYKGANVTYTDAETTTESDELNTSDAVEGNGEGGTTNDNDGTVNNGSGSGSGSGSSTSTEDGAGSEGSSDITTLVNELDAANSDFEQKLAKYVADPEGTQGSTSLYSLANAACSDVKTKRDALQKALGTTTASESVKALIDKAAANIAAFDAKVAEEQKELES